MICRNIFCIYWSEEECTLSEVSLDIQGNCENCIYVDVDENDLSVLRKTHIRKMYE